MITQQLLAFLWLNEDVSTSFLEGMMWPIGSREFVFGNFFCRGFGQVSSGMQLLTCSDLTTDWWSGLSWQLFSKINCCGCFMEQQVRGPNIWVTDCSKNKVMDTFELIFFTLCLWEECYEANFLIEQFSTCWAQLNTCLILVLQLWYKLLVLECSRPSALVSKWPVHCHVTAYTFIPDSHHFLILSTFFFFNLYKKAEPELYLQLFPQCWTEMYFWNADWLSVPWKKQLFFFFFSLLIFTAAVLGTIAMNLECVWLYSYCRLSFLATPICMILSLSSHLGFCFSALLVVSCRIDVKKVALKVFWGISCPQRQSTQMRQKEGSHLCVSKVWLAVWKTSFLSVS